MEQNQQENNIPETNSQPEEKKEEAKKKEQPELPKATRKWWVETLIASGIILLLSLIVFLVVYLIKIVPDEEHVVSITYSADKAIQFDSRFGVMTLVNGIILSVAYFLIYFFVRPSGIKPTFGPKKKYLVAWIILGLFGYLAYLVLAILFSGWGVSFAWSSFIASVLVGTYDYLIYKLYMEERTLSNAIFWEFFRFAIVGLVAAVFDLLTCTLVQFVAFRGNEEWYVTVVATACGFLIGVVINYLMSTYMVYKNAHSSFSKTAGGMITFFILSAIGLGIGIGLQYLLYDYLCLQVGVSWLSYPVDFVIRTLIVMVYNYITRKVFIYK